MPDQNPGTVIGQITVTADVEVIRAADVGSVESEEDES